MGVFKEGSKEIAFKLDLKERWNRKKVFQVSDKSTEVGETQENVSMPEGEDQTLSSSRQQRGWFLQCVQQHHPHLPRPPSMIFFSS